MRRPRATAVPADRVGKPTTSRRYLPVDLTDAAHITIYARRIKARDAWKYYCGVCWRMLTERQEAAREIVTGDEAGA